MVTPEVFVIIIDDDDGTVCRLYIEERDEDESALVTVVYVGYLIVTGG